MKPVDIQRDIIAEVNGILNERDLAQIQAFIRSLRQEIVSDEEHWHALPVVQRERMIAAVHKPDAKDDNWIAHNEVAAKYREWFD